MDNPEMVNENDKSLKIMFTALFGTGHVNACLGIGSLLHKRGHHIYFAHFPEHRNIIEKQGFEFISLLDYVDPSFPIMHLLPGQENNMRLLFESALRFTPLDQLLDGSFSHPFLPLTKTPKGENYAMIKIIEKYKPDICLADYLFIMPWMFAVDCPVIPIKSTNPMELYNGPPDRIGCSVHDSPEVWDKLNRLAQRSKLEVESELKKLFAHFNVEFKRLNYAKHFGIYIYPASLDYHELGQPREKWIRLDSALREHDTNEFVLPDKLKDKPGKLIYVSMGTVASVVPELIEKIIALLGKSPHRFIVSTGINGDSIKLHDNMWGDKYVNQVALLPKVDLFITHGGSNSIIEGLVAGKPLIVIPQFGDQPDNAQRIADLGLGVRVNLNELTGEKLLNAIEDVLNNEKIHSNVARVSEELKKSDSGDKVISLIEQLATNKNKTD